MRVPRLSSRASAVLRALVYKRDPRGYRWCRNDGPRDQKSSGRVDRIIACHPLSQSLIYTQGLLISHRPDPESHPTDILRVERAMGGSSAAIEGAETQPNGRRQSQRPDRDDDYMIRYRGHPRRAVATSDAQEKEEKEDEDEEEGWQRL